MSVISWFLEHGHLVIDLHSKRWREWIAQPQSPGNPEAQLERMVLAGRLRRLARGLYLIEEPGRDPDPIVVASQVFEDHTHYVTTDGAFRFHRMTEQPILEIHTVLPTGYLRLRGGIELAGVRIKAVNLAPSVMKSSDHGRTLDDLGRQLVVADPAQAVVDAVARPRWTAFLRLLPEMIGTWSPRRLERLAVAATDRSQAAAQRLGFLLDESGMAIPDELRQVRGTRWVQLNPASPGRRFSHQWGVFYP